MGKKKQKSVRITNPVTSPYTSFKSARRLVARHKAVWVEHPWSIQLLPEAVTEALIAQEHKQQIEEDLEQSIDRYRGVIGPDGKHRVVIWWNGNDRRKDAMHRPGEVVS